MDSTTDIAKGVRDDGIGWLIFENPAKLNAMSSNMTEQALEIISDFESDPSIRVVIMRGAGEKAFISGGDISKFEKTRFTPGSADSGREKSDQLRKKLVNINKPVIAMIHGYCLGGGMGIALCADMRFGSTTSQLGIPAAQRGLAYPPSALKLLVDLVGPSVARDILISAQRLKADEAHRVGLLNYVYAPEDLERETVAYAKAVACNAPLSIRASKFCINQLGLEHSRRDHETMQRMQDEAASSEDFKEATRSFMEKRKPLFRGV
jgi:enoyl-CoA hydratase/carnithine racemase